MNKFFYLGLACFLVVGFCGCAGNTNMTSFIRKDVDVSYIERVAVMPIQNNSKDSFVSERVRDMVITQILSMGLFDVVDKGLVDSALRDEAVDLAKAPMGNAVMKMLGQRLNAQAFLFGTIDNAQQIQRGAVSYPDLAITLRLVDIDTGSIFWQASGHRSGDSLGKRLFGLGSDDSFKVSMQLLRHLLDTIVVPAGNTTNNDNQKVVKSEANKKTSSDSNNDNEGEVMPLDDADQSSSDQVIDGSDTGDKNIDYKEGGTGGDSGTDGDIDLSPEGGSEEVIVPDFSAGTESSGAVKDDSGDDVTIPDFSDGSDNSSGDIIEDAPVDNGKDVNDDNVEPDMIPPE